jgi:predicted permease
MKRRKQMLHELDQDIQDHIQQEIDDNIGRGMSPEDARCAAIRNFGNVLLVKEETREVWTTVWLEQLTQDLRFAFRLIRRSPSFTVVAVLTLALAIGANAVVFAALNALILRPLNVPRAESLYSVHRISDNSANWSYPNYLDLRDRNRSFEDLAAYNILQAGLDTGTDPSSTWLLAVSGNYFDVLGIQPYLGRFFHAADERGPNSAPFMVLTYAYWHSKFQEDPNVVGRVVQVNKHPFTIIGVAPPGFHGTLLFFGPDYFLPIVNQEQVEGTSVLNARGRRWLFMSLGHLKPGVTPEQAAADFNALSADIERTFPKDHNHKTLALARPSLYGDYLGRPVRAFLAALMVLSGLILLAACANLGSLFAARAADRAREVALRLALGAGRLRILRQLFTEAILISLIGGAVGLTGSIVLLRYLSTWQPFPQFPINVPVSPDVRVYAVALLLALASGLLFGLVPVRQVLRTDPYEIVKAGATCTADRRFSARDLLVVAQIAICAVLVTSSMVAVRGLMRSLHSDFGFDPHNVMLASTILDMAGYRGDAVPAMQKRMIDAVQTIPGVVSVGMTNGAPLTNADLNGAMIFSDETADLRPANATATAVLGKVSPDYLRAAGTALLSGRTFTWHDDKDAPPVAMINQEFARRVFGSPASALGQYFKMRDGTRTQVIGIVEDGKYESLTEDPKLAVFVPILQSPTTDTMMIVRSDRDPQQVAAAIRSKVRGLDAGLPTFIQSWNEAMNLILFPTRVATVALGVLGLMGAMLSITGIFGLAAYSVSKRMKELGIRVALGAQRKEVLQAALGRALKLLAFGSVAGLLLGILATRVLASIVYQATPRDPFVLAGAVLAMAFLGLLATWIPAQRALAVDPLILLREQ